MTHPHLLCLGCYFPPYFMPVDQVTRSQYTQLPCIKASDQEPPGIGALQSLAYAHTQKVPNLPPNCSSLPINYLTSYTPCSSYNELCHWAKAFSFDARLAASACLLCLLLYLANVSFFKYHLRDAFFEHLHPNSGKGPILWLPLVSCLLFSKIGDLTEDLQLDHIKQQVTLKWQEVGRHKTAQSHNCIW